jgi:hypothetical protein
VQDARAHLRRSYARHNGQFDADKQDAFIEGYYDGYDSGRADFSQMQLGEKQSYDAGYRYGVRIISREGILITRDTRIVSTRRPSPISVEATRTDTPLRGSVGIDALAEALEDASGAHAASNAHGNHAVAGVATLQFTHERRRELCAGAAERVA